MIDKLDIHKTFDASFDKNVGALLHEAATLADQQNRRAVMVDGIAGALKATSNGLLSLLGPVAVLGLTWLGLKAIVLGKNPLKS
jgi:hypothetical protein